MFVGEQPEDRENREGVPFTGPAGALFDRPLEEAGIDRKSADPARTRRRRAPIRVSRLRGRPRPGRRGALAQRRASSI
jgi:uracil-DNA glycosylase